MSQSLNKVTLIGRLGKDPETRYTASGQCVANFSLATDESYTDREGEKQKKTEWHNIVVWGKAAESFVAPYLHKGDLVCIEGKLQTRSWEDKRDGSKHYTTEINTLNIVGLVIAPSQQTEQAKPAQNAGSRQAQGRSTQSRQPSRSSQNDDNPAHGVSDEDIPF